MAAHSEPALAFGEALFAANRAWCSRTVGAAQRGRLGQRSASLRLASRHPRRPVRYLYLARLRVDAHAVLRLEVPHAFTFREQRCAARHVDSGSGRIETARTGTPSPVAITVDLPMAQTYGSGWGRVFSGYRESGSGISVGPDPAAAYDGIRVAPAAAGLWPLLPRTLSSEVKQRPRPRTGGVLRCSDREDDPTAPWQGEGSLVNP